MNSVLRACYVPDIRTGELPTGHTAIFSHTLPWIISQFWGLLQLVSCYRRSGTERIQPGPLNVSVLGMHKFISSSWKTNPVCWHLLLFLCSHFRASIKNIGLQNLPANEGDARDTGLFPRLRRSPAGGNGNPLPYSCLENPMDRGTRWATAHGPAKRWTQLSTEHTHTQTHTHTKDISYQMSKFYYKTIRLPCQKKVHWLSFSDGAGKILYLSIECGEKNSDALPVHLRTVVHLLELSISLPLATTVAFNRLLLPSLGDLEASSRLLCSQVPKGKFYKSFQNPWILQVI